MMIAGTHYQQLTAENTVATLKQLKAQVLKGGQ